MQSMFRRRTAQPQSTESTQVRDELATLLRNPDVTIRQEAWNNKLRPILQAPLADSAWVWPVLVDLLLSSTLETSYAVICFLRKALHQDKELPTERKARNRMLSERTKRAHDIIKAQGINALFNWMQQHEDLFKLLDKEDAIAVFDLLVLLIQRQGPLASTMQKRNITLLFNFLCAPGLQEIMMEKLLGLLSKDEQARASFLTCFSSEEHKSLLHQLVGQGAGKILSPFLFWIRGDSLEQVMDKQDSQAAAATVNEWCSIYNPENFTEIKKLGQGSFAQVFESSMKNPSHPQVQTIGVKKFRSHYKGRDTVVDFKNEVLIHSTLNHPNIVAFLGIYFNESVRHIVLELASSTLADIFTDNHHTLLWPQRIKIAMDIAKALVYVHGLDIIHADISSSNVLMMDDGTAKLADFGLARLCQSPKSVAGTPDYKAPELCCANSTGCTQASDVFAFAMVLAEISRRKRVWEEHGPSFIPWANGYLFNEKTGRPILADDTPAEFKDVICGGWKTDSTQRYKMADILPKLSNLYENNSSLAASANVSRELFHHDPNLR